MRIINPLDFPLLIFYELELWFEYHISEGVSVSTRKSSCVKLSDVFQCFMLFGFE